MQQIIYCFNIDHKFTPVYHPSANPVERKNRDLKTQLAILLGNNHDLWPDKLPSIRFAINTTPCQSTGQTPAYLTFARELRAPADVTDDLRQIIQNENFVPEVTPRLLQMTDTLEKAKEVHEQQQDKRKEYADQRRRPGNTYQPGDLVWVTSHVQSQARKGRTSKFNPRRDGPYQILTARGPCSYEIASSSAPTTVLGTYHVSALSPFQGPKSQEPPTPVQPLKKRGRPRKNQQ